MAAKKENAPKKVVKKPVKAGKTKPVKRVKEAKKVDSGSKLKEGQQEFNADMKLEYINNSKPKIQFVAALGYLVFFIPLIFYPNERFARFHANQALLFLLFTLGAYAISTALYFIWAPLGLVFLPLTFVVSLLFVSLGICNASAGKAESLPCFGSLTIIKTDKKE